MDRAEREAFEEAVDRERAGIPDALPDWMRDWMISECERQERILRLQHEGTLPPDVQTNLASMNTATDEGLLRRWAYLKHLYRKRSEGLEPSRRLEENQEAMRRLLTTEPVTVTLSSGRAVEVTDRSYVALIEIARHSMRVSALEDDLAEVRSEREAIEEAVTDSPTDGEELARRREEIRSLSDRADLLLTEIELHRRAIFAHLFAERGGPAEALDAAPDWWREITPVDEVRLIYATREVGPDRLHELGPQPERPDRDKEPRRLEDYGWKSVLAGWGMEDPDPAEVFQRPLAQQVATHRAGAPPVWEDA